MLRVGQSAFCSVSWFLMTHEDKPRNIKTIINYPYFAYFWIKSDLRGLRTCSENVVLCLNPPKLARLRWHFTSTVQACALVPNRSKSEEKRMPVYTSQSHHNGALLFSGWDWSGKCSAFLLTILQVTTENSSSIRICSSAHAWHWPSSFWLFRTFWTQTLLLHNWASGWNRLSS